MLKERRPPGYFLPHTLDDHLVEHLTAPHLDKRLLPDGRSQDVWRFDCDPHLYDCEKYQEVLGYVFVPALLQQFRTRQDAYREKLRALLAGR